MNRIDLFQRRKYFLSLVQGIVCALVVASVGFGAVFGAHLALGSPVTSSAPAEEQGGAAGRIERLAANAFVFWVGDNAPQALASEAGDALLCAEGLPWFSIDKTLKHVEKHGPPAASRVAELMSERLPAFREQEKNRKLGVGPCLRLILG